LANHTLLVEQEVVGMAHRHTHYQYAYLDLVGCVDLLTAINIMMLQDY